MERMQTAKRRRTTLAITASAIAHLALGIVVVLQHPTLRLPVEASGPPEAIIPVLILPKTPPAAAGKLARPSPVRLHRRPQRFVPPEVPTAPIAPPTPPAPPAARPAPSGPIALHAAPMPEGPKGDVRAALRHGAPGCANALTVGLTRAERELCDEKFGKGAKDAPFYAPGLALSPGKKALLDKAAAGKDADIRYKEANPQPGISAEAGDSGQPSKPRSLEEPPPPRLPR